MMVVFTWGNLKPCHEVEGEVFSLRNRSTCVACCLGKGEVIPLTFDIEKWTYLSDVAQDHYDCSSRSCGWYCFMLKRSGV